MSDLSRRLDRIARDRDTQDLYITIRIFSDEREPAPDWRQAPSGSARRVRIREMRDADLAKETANA